MTTADEMRQLYGKDEGYSYVTDYMPIIRSFGGVLIEIADDGYHGDSYILYTKHGPTSQLYGILVFGWGSCSGCDALQACDTWEDVAELYNQLESQIKWFTESEARAYVKNKDWSAEWFVNRETGAAFVGALRYFFNVAEDEIEALRYPE